MLLKKISAKTVMGDVQLLIREKATVDGKEVTVLKNDGEVIDLMTIYGRVNGFKSGVTDNGEFIAFTGQFEAINLMTGEESSAPKIFVVEPLQGMILAQLAEAESVDFAVKLSLIVNSDAIRGYEYRVTPLIEAKRTDALEGLRALALAAPRTAPAIEHKGDEPKEVGQEAASETPKKKK